MKYILIRTRALAPVPVVFITTVQIFILKKGKKGLDREFFKFPTVTESA